MSARQTLEPLTKRQREVLDLLVRGRTNYEIAQHLGISLDGAKWHVREVLARLGVESREQAADVWRRERSWLARGTALVAGMLGGSAAKVAVAGAVVLAVAGLVSSALYLSRDDDDMLADTDSTPAPGTPVTATVPPAPDDLSPRSGIPIVDAVMDIARRGDLLAFRALMKEFPEPCTNGRPGVGSPPPCPSGAADGTPVETFRAVASERVDQGPDLEQLLSNVVSNYTRLYAVARTTFDRFPGTLPPSKYEVIVVPALSSGESAGAIYFLDDTGIVGLYADDFLGLLEHLEDVQPDQWIIAPNVLARVRAERTLYVIGRDVEILFSASLLAPVCVGKPFVIRLFAYPDPGVAGGIQVSGEPGLAVEVHATVGPLGDRVVGYALPASVSTPMHLRPGLQSPCLSDIAVQGEVELALLAPPEDAEVATFEILGSLLDQPAGSAPTVAEFLGGELTASVAGYACHTVSLADRSLRNTRGNVVFRVGSPDQPTACRSPGAPVVFVMTGTGDPNNPSALSTQPEYVPGTIRLIRNYGPEPPHREPRAPLQ